MSYAAIRIFVLFVLLIPAGAVIAQEPTFDAPGVAQDAEAFENYLQNSWPSRGKDAKGWRAEGVKAMQANNPRAATGFFASSVVLDRNHAETWIALAQAYLAIETQNYSEKYNFSRNAGSSAYLAWQRAQSPALKARALAVLADSLGRRSQWRSALSVYRASLALAPDED